MSVTFPLLARSGLGREAFLSIRKWSKPAREPTVQAWVRTRYCSESCHKYLEGEIQKGQLCLQSENSFSLKASPRRLMLKLFVIDSCHEGVKFIFSCRLAQECAKLKQA